MFLSTLQILFELDNILMGVMGSIIGIIFGAIPGLSGTTAMALLLPAEKACLCIDSVKLVDGSFLDVGAPVGPALPVVVKTLVLGQ